MPELVPLYEHLCELVGGGDAAARFLSLYRPTPFMTGCSQAAWIRRDESPTLVRNYDYAPHLYEGVNLFSAWNGSRCITMTDCFWGALDGLNEHGLAVALAFGGRRVVGDGFAIPLVLRYVLDTCATMDEAVATLSRVPSHMAYNVLVLDRDGRTAVVQVAPDHKAVILDERICTNHQGDVDWPEHARLTRTLEREAYLRETIDLPTETLDTFIARFLSPPLNQASTFRHWRTLYTAVYQPREGICTYLWPEVRRVQSLDGFISDAVP